jgi:hypothetical protein
VSEIKYHYTTYHMQNLTVPDDVVITPKMERELIRKINEAVDRIMMNTLACGHDIGVNQIGRKGVTIDHVPRRKLLK